MMEGRSLLVLALAGVLVATVLGGQPPADYEGGCSDAGCHDQFSKRAHVHDPIGEGLCDSCHKPSAVAVHKFDFTEKGGALCMQCHDEHEGKRKHAPAMDGDCDACHDPHASDTKGLLKGKSVAVVCAECHDQTGGGLTFLHGPTAVGECTICHDPHASQNAGLAVIDGPELCYRCHRAMQARMTQKTYKHDPVEEECTACHNPHGADNNMMLSSKPPALCLDCHDTTEQIVADAPVQHDALSIGKSCTSCHQAHASDINYMLLREPMDLCLSCHNHVLDSGADKLCDVAKLLNENTSHHGPIIQENCTGCHKVHGGESFRMLVEDFPSSFYASFDEHNYGLCFRCHEPDLVRNEKTTKLTNFRNGEENLHYVHVNRKPKGRTCRACHNVHASKNPKHITEIVKFGIWEIPLNFEKTATGGSCQPGCHRVYRYDQGKCIVNVPKPDAG